MDNNKRRFQRIPFDAEIQLELDNLPEKAVHGHLLDISLKGALVQIESPPEELTEGERGELTVSPLQGGLVINLTVEVAYAHPDKQAFGLNLISLDIDSAAHLRRLIEVNLGDENLLQRELSNLVHAMEAEHDV